MSAPSRLRSHAEQIWRAGLAAVDSELLVSRAIAGDGSKLRIGQAEIDLSRTDRIVVVGAGKAGAGMAAGFEAALKSINSQLLQRVTGWVNVPSDCVTSLQRIKLHAARPAGVNEPRPEGVVGTREIVRLLRSLNENDACVVLLSGGGSALLPAPHRGITLDDKLRVTRLLMTGGATINELNCVRRHLSELKGGGIVSQTNAGTIASLIISDVVGDPLDVIASGPTVPDSTTAADALTILKPFGNAVPNSVLAALNEARSDTQSNFERVTNTIIGNNAAAMTACEHTAMALGYAVRNHGSNNKGIAAELGVQLAEEALAVRDSEVAKPVCIISGGEPTVQLCDQPGKGGRNQELVLAALNRLGLDADCIAILSGGTDGEDGPTDAAGGVVTQEAATLANQLRLSAGQHLASNNAYPFLAATNALLKTGPTHTNVMDIRIALIDPTPN